MADNLLTATPPFVKQLSDALQERLPGAAVDHECIRGDRYRFEVIWDRFNEVSHPERQRQVWGIAEQALAKPDLLNVGMILTIAPQEIAVDE